MGILDLLFDHDLLMQAQQLELPHSHVVEQRRRMQLVKVLKD